MCAQSMLPTDGLLNRSFRISLADWLCDNCDLNTKQEVVSFANYLSPDSFRGRAITSDTGKNLNAVLLILINSQCAMLWELALIQTKHVISLLKELHPTKKFEIITMNTLGDTILDKPLPKIGEKSLFTKELETALETGDVDFVVHSLKDLPTCLPGGMAIGAVLTREDPRDALVLQKDLKELDLSTLPKDSVIGTSSLRRTAQLARTHPHLIVKNIRGNLNTRLRKLDDLGIYQAIILAAAGLIRIGWKERISQFLETEELMYAVGQGALAVECREDNENILKLLEPLYDVQTALRVIAERSFLKTLGGGCSAPVAVSSVLRVNPNKDVELILNGAVWSLDGFQEIKDADKVTVEVSNGIRCSICPFNNNTNVAVEDIESCIKCPNAQSAEPLVKRQKLEVPSEILRNDPHEKCPIPLPVGSDFMGACPYLEGEMGSLQGMGNLLETSSSFDQIQTKTCPFLKKMSKSKTVADSSNLLQLTDIEKKQLQDPKTETLYVGLVAHRKVSKDDLESARMLGERLARKLMAQGASDVMAKAQAIIHADQGKPLMKDGVVKQNALNLVDKILQDKQRPTEASAPSLCTK